MGIDTSKNNKIINSTGFTRKVLLLAPFIQLLLWLNSLEPFLFWGLHRFFIDFIILVILSIALYLLLKVFFLIAKQWQKIVLCIYIAFFLIQTGVGIMYKYYEPNQEKFTINELNSIEKFISNEMELPCNMNVLIWNDSIGVIGKKVKKGAWGYKTSFNDFIIDDNIDEAGGKLYINKKISQPSDFSSYKELITETSIMDNDFTNFWVWQYPKHLIYIYIKNFKCEDYITKDVEPCYRYYSKVFVRGLDRFDPILEEIFEGKLDDRYRNFYKFFKKLANPTYVRTDLANDPYFLIYQGKYKEAREGLKDLPPARREFCEKKLETLGY